MGFQKGQLPPHKPRATRTVLRKVRSNLAVAIQNRVGVEVMHEWWVIIMKGRHYPMLIEECGSCDHWDHSHTTAKVDVLGPCKECDCRDFEPGLLRAVPDELSPVPRHEDRMRAAQELNDRGWGKPVQSIELEGHIQNNVEIHGVNDALPDGALPLAKLRALQEALRLGDGGSSPSNGGASDDIADAEFVDTPQKP